MSKEKPRFEDFLMCVGPDDIAFVKHMHEFFTKNGCEVNIKDAKNGYVVSYVHTGTKKTVVNYVFRKKGLIMRIYGDNVGSYQDFIDVLPDGMADAIEKAPICKRLADTEKCNSRCPMGYIFALRGQEQKKCRYNGFMFLLDDESKPYVKEFVEREMRERCA